jgi:CBS domain-containing protein
VAHEQVSVAQLMDVRVRTLSLDVTAREVAKKMAQEKTDCIVITEGERPVGVITERDLIVKILSDGFDPDKVLARDIMSTALVTVSPEDTMGEAARLMSEYKIRRLLVVDDERMLVGIATADDLAKVLAKGADYKDPALNVMGRINETHGSGPYQ